VLSIDRYAYINRLRKIHPLEKTLFAGIPMVLCLVFERVSLHAFVMMSMALVTLVAAGIPSRFYLKILLLPLPFVLLSILAIVVNLSGTPGLMDHEISFFSIFIGFKEVSLRRGLMIFTRSYACVSCLYFISLTTPVVDIAWILRKMRVPAVFVELLTIIYRFIFELIDTAFQIKVSQESRLGYSSLTKSYRSLGQLITNLFAKALKNYRDITVAMESRLYQGEFRVLERDYLISARNLCLLVVYVTIAVSLAVFW
jgi:cobalt/nickel transport system permease protein